MILLLVFAFVFGIASNGLLYPIRIIDVILFLLCPLGAEALLGLLTNRSKKIRILIVFLVIAVTFLSIFWTYRIVQRTVPTLIKMLSSP